MKKLLLSIALLASCASVMAVTHGITTHGDGPFQFYNSQAQIKPNYKTLPTQQQPSGQALNYTIHGDGHVQVPKPYVTAAQPRG